MRISDWSSDVCSSDLVVGRPRSAGTLLRAEFRPPRRHRLDRGDERLARRARWPLDGIRAAAEPGLRRQLARAAEGYGREISARYGLSRRYRPAVRQLRARSASALLRARKR